jgi:hypothetical protein
MTFELNAIAQASTLRIVAYTIIDCLLEGTFIALFAGPKFGCQIRGMVFRTGRDRSFAFVWRRMVGARREHFCRSRKPSHNQRAGFLGNLLICRVGCNRSLAIAGRWPKSLAPLRSSQKLRRRRSS